MLPETVLIYLQLKANFIIISYLAKKIKYCYSYNVLREALGSSLNSKPLCLVKPSGHGASLRVTRRARLVQHTLLLRSVTFFSCVSECVYEDWIADAEGSRRSEKIGSGRAFNSRQVPPQSPHVVSEKMGRRQHKVTSFRARRRRRRRVPIRLIPSSCLQVRLVSFRVRTRDSVPLGHTVVSADCSLLSLSLFLFIPCYRVPEAC